MIIYESKTKYKKVGEIEGDALDEPAKVEHYMRGAFDEYPLQEQVWVIMLNRKNFPIGRQMVTLGTNTACLASPSAIFRPAILSGATAVHLAHNHISGDPDPSGADLRLTKKIKEAGDVLDIQVHDHIIIGHGTGRFYSFSDAGIL